MQMMYKVDQLKTIDMQIMFFQVEKDQENIQLFPAPVQNKSSLSLGEKRV